jgi:uncharacterized protein YicC (UPF0701 family)
MMEKGTKGNTEERKIVVKIRKPEPAAATLFSEGEVRKIVSEFVSSWIRGDITIRFPTAAELAKKTPLSIAFPTDPSVNAELKIKEHYIDLVSVLAGTKKASAEEQKKAVDEVFKMLLMFRSANRIEGKIISNDFEKRLMDVEKNLNQTAKLVEQITGFLFKEKKKPAAAKKREG